MSHHVSKVKLLAVEVADSVGAGAKFFETIAAAGVNLVSFCAYTMGDTAGFLVDAGENAAAATKALKKAGYKVAAQSALAIAVANKPGALAAEARKLADKGMNVQMAYATPGGKTATVYLSADDDKKAFKVLEK